MVLSKSELYLGVFIRVSLIGKSRICPLLPKRELSGVFHVYVVDFGDGAQINVHLHNDGPASICNEFPLAVYLRNDVTEFDFVE